MLPPPVVLPSEIVSFPASVVIVVGPLIRSTSTTSFPAPVSIAVVRDHARGAVRAVDDERVADDERVPVEPVTALPRSIVSDSRSE